jgi:hypothetical protein
MGFNLYQLDSLGTSTLTVLSSQVSAEEDGRVNVTLNNEIILAYAALIEKAIKEASG